MQYSPWADFAMIYYNITIAKSTHRPKMVAGSDQMDLAEAELEQVIIDACCMFVSMYCVVCELYEL